MSELLRFAAEFVTFLVSSAGLALVLLRSELLSRNRLWRGLLGLGFAALAASAFVAGSLIAGSPEEVAVVAFRIVGVVLLAAGAARAEAPARVRAGIGAGAAVVLLATPLAERAAGAALLVIGAVLVGGALLDASRRSVAARVAASAAAALLVLVLVLSVALSSVLTATVEREAVERLEGRARREATAVQNAVRDVALPAARLAAASLEGEALAFLQAAAATPAPSPEITRRLEALSATYLSGRELAYLAPDGSLVAQTGGVAGGALRSIAEDRVVKRLLGERPSGGTEGTRPEATTVVVAADGAAAVAVTATGFTTPADPTFQRLGAAVAIVPVDIGYLRQQRRDDPRLAFAVVAGRSVVATSPGGAQPAEADLVDLAGGASSRTFRDHYSASAPIEDERGNRVASFVVSTDRRFVDDTRDTLFRTLFLIALGSTLLALLFAALVGDRIGAGLRRLTTAAGSIRAGDLDARAGIRSADEVGVLGEAFDSMVTTLAAQRDALAAAAEQEAALRNRLEAIVQGMGEGLLAVDVDGLVTDVNRAAETLLGASSEDLIGRPLAEVTRLVAEAAPQRDLVGALGARKAWTDVALLGEEPVPVAVTATPLSDATGERTGGVALLRDLRDERALDTMKREFLSRVGHELRTPLAIITGYSRILSRRDATSDQVHEWAGYISDKAHELERIIEMLEFFAASGGGHELAVDQPTDLRAVVAQAIARWDERLDGRRTIRSRLGRSKVEVKSHPQRLARCLDELIDNAIKFSPESSSVVVTLRRVDGEAVVTVADKGNGMTDQEIDGAFTAFVQGDASDTRHYGGLGLGLPFAQRVVESNGGRVVIDSTPGRGSKVSIHLPVASG